MAGGSAPAVTEDRNMDNNDSSSASSTCGDISSSNSVDSTARRSPTSDRVTMDASASGKRPTSATGDTGESSSATNTSPHSPAGAFVGDTRGANNASSASPTSLQEEQGGSNPASAGSSPPNAATPEPANAATGGGGGGGTPATTKSASAKKTKDCHEVVKSSAMAGERRGNLCTVHQNGIRKTRVNVSCQTDPDETVFPKMSSQCSRMSAAQPPASKATAVATASTAETSSASSSTSSDGTLRLMIQNFKNMADTVRGPSKKIQAVPWRIMVMPRQHVVQKKGTQKCLGFFLQCCPDAYSDSWSCQAAAELRLISQKQGIPNFTRKTNHVYTAKENDWGYSCFMTWADILDESQGYIKEDKVILEVSVKAEPPKNILTHDQFEKKIQDYMRLADLQSSRGLIDKAIEVNQSALKFCKDRDQDCKAELEAQKTKLIEMKLKQSIERIEKGPPTGKSEEENSLNQNALKQAISGTPATIKQSNANKSAAKATGNGRSRDSSNVEKNGSVQNRPQTPPPPSKGTVEAVHQTDTVVSETRTATQTEKSVCIVPGITTTCRGSQGFTTSSTTTTLSKDTPKTFDAPNEVLMASPYKAPWIVEDTTTGGDGDQNSKRNVDFCKLLEDTLPPESDRLTHSPRDVDQNRVAVEKNTFIMNKQNEIIRSRAMMQNVSSLAVRNNKHMMEDIKKLADDAYEEELRRQSLKRIKYKAPYEILLQKNDKAPNADDTENDAPLLNRLTEDPEAVKAEQFLLRTMDPRNRKITQKAIEVNENKYGLSPGTGPMWRNPAYKADITGHNQPWKTLCEESELKEPQPTLDYSSEDETASSAGVSSDSEAEGNGSRTALGMPLSKKMKRSCDDPDGLPAVLRDDCDSCIQAMLDPLSSTTEEASCQTDYSMMYEGNKQQPKVEAAIVAARTGAANTTSPPRPYAQPKKQARKTVANGFETAKFDSVEWQKKKLAELKEMEAPRKKIEDTRVPTESIAERVEAAAELTKESIAPFTSHFTNSSDPKLFQALPPLYSPSPQQIFGDDLPAPQFQPSLDDTAQPNVWSRQYIEEWLKFNIKYCWKYIKNGENSPTGGDELGIDLTSGTIPHFNDAQVQQVMAALSVIGVNCVNAKRVVDKAAEFINTLESRSKSPFLKECLQKLAVLAGDEKALESPKESRKNDFPLITPPAIESYVDGHLIVDADGRPANQGVIAGSEDGDDLSAIMSSMDCPDDQHDYMLNREVHRIGVFADQAVSKNPLMELGQAEKLSEHTEKIAARIAALECDKESLTKQLTAEKERNKRLEQKHTNSLKAAQSQLQAEKDKHEKTVQQLNQKKNELKKQEKVLKQHEKDVERARELQDKVDYLTKEMQELRQKHADDLRKLQRELQSSQDTRKNMSEEIKGRDAEIQELRSQLNERSSALKRSENALCSERKSFQSTLSAITERAKKAEVLYLETKLETGLCILERAYKDAGQRVKDLEMEQKKLRNSSHIEEIKTVIAEWKAKREEVAVLINTSKSEFNSQIDQIKSGKPLSQLPRISVAKPPPAPKPFKLGQYSLQTTGGAEKTASAATPSVGVIGQNTRSVPSQAGIIGTPLSPSSVAPGSPVQSISKAPAPPSTLSPLKTSIATSTTIAPIGVRPNSHANGSTEFSNNNSTSVCSSHSNPQPSTSTSGSSITLPTAWGSSTWEPPLVNSINDLLNTNRSFGPIGTDYGIGSAGTAANQLSQPPPGLTNVSNHFGAAQSNGWGSTGGEWSNCVTGPSGMNNGSVVSNQHGQYNHVHQPTGGYQSGQWAGGWPGYHTSQTGGSPDVANALLDNSRSSSPRRDVLLDALRNHFPQISPDTLKEYANDFLVRNNCTNLKTLPISEIVNYVAQVIATKQMWNKTSMPAMLHQPPPNVIVPSPVGMSGIDTFQSPPSRIHGQQSAVHHVLMQQQQLRDGMEN